MKRKKTEIEKFVKTFVNAVDKNYSVLSISDWKKKTGFELSEEDKAALHAAYRDWVKAKEAYQEVLQKQLGLQIFYTVAYDE